jgi:hypothetical protein
LIMYKKLANMLYSNIHHFLINKTWTNFSLFLNP